MPWLKDSIATLYDLNKNLKTDSAKELLGKIKTPDRFVFPTQLEDVSIGKFYFVFYDLTGKTNKMEQYSPVLFIDYKQVKTKKYLYGISFNFIPVNIRILYFDQLLNKFNNTIQNNIKVDTLEKEQPLRNINYELIYKTLFTSGFEYSIREFDVSKITKCYNIATQYLPHFLVFDTQLFTGVDEVKLIDIWKVKIHKQQERNKEIMIHLQKNYDEMAKTFEKEFDVIKDDNYAFAKSLSQLKNKIG